MRRTFILFLLLVTGFLSCDNNRKSNAPEKETTEDQSPEVPLVAAPAFVADSAFAFVEKQVAFGPRIPGTPAQSKCAAWLAARLRSYSDTVYVQDLQVEVFDGTTVPCTNIIASFQPGARKRILLFAHWDTRPWSDRDAAAPRKAFDGADDGGSGVAVLLEIARLLKENKPAVGIDIALFDVEDYGAPEWYKMPENKDPGFCLGSQEWSGTPHIPGYRAYYGILVDMVGAHQATFVKEGTSLQYAPSIVERVWNTAASLNYGNYFLDVSVQGIIDDHYYVNRMNQTPSIDIINLKPGSRTGFAPHWHTQADNLTVIDSNTLKAVGQTILQVIFNEPADLS